MLNGEPRGFLNRLVWALVGLSAISMGVVPYLQRRDALHKLVRRTSFYTCRTAGRIHNRVRGLKAGLAAESASGNRVKRRRDRLQ